MTKTNMRKSFDKYGVFIFDLDGTLYYQKKLRFIMAKRLLCYYIIHPLRIKELLILKKFREVRDKWDNIGINSNEKSIDELQYEHVANLMNSSFDAVEAIIKKWIYDNPLDALLKSKDEVIAEHIRKIREQGKKVVIFSDYPVEDKIKALNIETDGMYCSADESINALKPSPKGLLKILDDMNASSDEAVMVGDRMEKDGLCAQNAKIDYLILERASIKRKKQYSILNIE